MRYLKLFVPVIIMFTGVVIGNACEGGRCTGSSSCTACKNCSRCAHCKGGGSCGVCAVVSTTSKSSKPSKTKVPVKKGTLKKRG